MTDYRIRIYKDSDYETVRDLFANGLKEHVPPLQKYALNLPRTKLFLLGVLFTLFLAFKYFLISALEAALCLAIVWSALLVVIWFGSNQIFNSYIQHCLKQDMFDIQKYYMQRKGACFWVAESNGQVVGMVAAEPYNDADGWTKVELKRLSVRLDHRGQGIGKALCWTVINFGRQESYESVILETTMVQYTGQKLYESLGFKKIRCSIPPSFFRRLMHFLVVYYRYDILAHN